jgi:alpha-L-fucosidase
MIHATPQPNLPATLNPDGSPTRPGGGSQRHALARLEAWEALRYGMFIHFGMSTFTGSEFPSGNDPASLYNPTRLDVDQWVCVARDAGMKYAVLTTKHVAGYCLWPSRHTDYHVGNSPVKTDVVDAFVRACERRGVLPGLYYCSWDNHHRFGSITPTDIMALRETPEVNKHYAEYATRAYLDFQAAQIDELFSSCGPVTEVWIDIPPMLPRFFRHELYDRLAMLQPEAVVMMNHGIGDGAQFKVRDAWPTDLVAIERFLPNAATGHVKWREIEGRRYYMPGEVCDPIGKEWFYTDDDQPRSDAELLGMYLTTTSRGANFLLDVGPDKHGLIPPRYVAALQRLRANLDRLGPL